MVQREEKEDEEGSEQKRRLKLSQCL